jgi:hypothetical protein
VRTYGVVQIDLRNFSLAKFAHDIIKNIRHTVLVLMQAHRVPVERRTYVQEKFSLDVGQSYSEFQKEFK